MPYYPPSANIIRSPKQASNTFSNPGGLPRQRNVFIVRFIPNVIIGGISNRYGNLTFAAKTVDRPKINPKTEELHQYNKKRQIYTGYKLEPIRMQFYDSADGAAQLMWADYGKYYFGDLNDLSGDLHPASNPAYAYDVTTNMWRDPANTGFGFTAKNGGATDDNSQFFFERIELYHFYDQMYDLYHLVHPKISSFEPDDLDYTSSDISVINTQIVYENLQYFSHVPVSGTQFEEFSTAFFGDPVIVEDFGFPNPMSQSMGMSNLLPSFPSIGSLLSANLNVRLGGSSALNFRFFDPSGSAIGTYGNFTFGPSSQSYQDKSLTTMALGNPALTAALNLNSNNIDPLSQPSPVMFSALTATTGIDGAVYDSINTKTKAALSGYGNADSVVRPALLAAKEINGSGASVNSSGQIVLSPESYGVINTQMTGTAQYGFNTQTDIVGNSWGFNGPNGYSGPIGPQNPGPYNTNQPAGIDGRFVKPMDVV